MTEKTGTEQAADYQQTAEAVLARLGSDLRRGLSAEEARVRLERYGRNELEERSGRGPWAILWEQFTSTMIVILIVAAVVSALLGDYEDSIAIAVIVVLNAALGFGQEYRAERAMDALKRLSAPTVKVRRDGHVREVSARELVPGDVVLLEAGNLVAADGRLLEEMNLRVQESALTGESEPVEKDPVALEEEDPPLGERTNMVYSSTVVTKGRGLYVVTGTGMATELGKIAAMIQTADREQTPLQRRLDQVGKVLALAALVIVGVVFALGLLRGEDLELMFLTAVSLAVAAVPEGLPAVVTIALALGAQRMLGRRALIRKLPAVETLGSVTVICSDKTGTLTENRMTATVLDVADRTVELGRGSHAASEPGPDGLLPAVGDDPALALLLGGAALCNDALLDEGDEKNGLRALGDPTEGALVVAAAREGLKKPELEAALPRVEEVPFDSVRKRMTTVHEVLPDSDAGIPDTLGSVLNEGSESAPYVAFTKGAVDSLLEISNEVWSNGQTEPLNGGWRERISAANERLAENGVRVLGVGFRHLRSFDGGTDELERDLTFLGMVGMIDPARPEARDAVETCKRAGIRPVMITGDHPLTAQHIATELGIAQGGRILTGRELDRLSVEELEDLLAEVPVFARVSPKNKLDIVEALQDKGHIVAMTGDGVNDAPALRKADIGVAMGVTGTDVSKEAADMVLTDDNFATIVAAVEQGRVIYDNIRKFIKYLLTSNSAEILVMLVAPFLGLGLPLLPLQILWINLVTDGPPALALSAEPTERGTMRRPPHPPDETVFARGLGRHVLWVGMLMALVSLGVGIWYQQTAPELWQTMVFTTLTLSQMSHVMAIRSGDESLFRVGLLSNKPLLGAVILTFVLQLFAIYVPFFQGFLETEALPIADFAIAVALSTLIFWGVEVEKWLARRRSSR
ncbi:MAG TPA: cation-translocating P-type ATPase [Rubrobacteraceae bacterium]|nr:cation-translocating P-type ATPase [Rubrobacteraceae bacterium]